LPRPERSSSVDPNRFTSRGNPKSDLACRSIERFGECSKGATCPWKHEGVVQVYGPWKHEEGVPVKARDRVPEPLVQPRSTARERRMQLRRQRSFSPPIPDGPCATAEAAARKARKALVNLHKAALAAGLVPYERPPGSRPSVLPRELSEEPDPDGSATEDRHSKQVEELENQVKNLKAAAAGARPKVESRPPRAQGASSGSGGSKSGKRKLSWEPVVGGYFVRADDEDQDDDKDEEGRFTWSDSDDAGRDSMARPSRVERNEDRQAKAPPTKKRNRGVRAPLPGSKKSGKGPRMPLELVGMSSSTPQGSPICFNFNLDGCKPGERCPKGFHVCCRPGCGKQDHGCMDHDHAVKPCHGLRMAQ
jgi:hypothetical protein